MNAGLEDKQKFRVWHVSPLGEIVQSCASAEISAEAERRVERAFPQHSVVGSCVHNDEHVATVIRAKSRKLANKMISRRNS